MDWGARSQYERRVATSPVATQLRTRHRNRSRHPEQSHAGERESRNNERASAAARELLEIANTIDCPRHASSCRQWLPTRRYLDDRRPLGPTFDIAESNKLSDYSSNKSFLWGESARMESSVVG